jgi:hypothetical protein
METVYASCYSANKNNGMNHLRCKALLMHIAPPFIDFQAPELPKVRM